MSIDALIGLLLRQLAIVTLLGAVGLSLTFFLRGAPGLARLALAPALGLALLAAELMTVNALIPSKQSAFLVVAPLAVLSLVFAAYQTSKDGRHVVAKLLRAWPLALGAMAVAVAVSHPVAKHDSLGPHGFRVADFAGYVALADGLKEHKLTDERADWGPIWDRKADYAHGQASGFQHVGSTVVAANIGGLFGWHSSELQTSYMTSLIVVGALACAGGAYLLTRRRRFAALALLLYAGPITYQLFIDGSEGALAGLAVAAGLLAASAAAWRERRLAALAAVAILLAGLQSVYAPFLVPLLLATALALSGWLLVELRGNLSWRPLARAGVAVVTVAAAAAAIAPAATSRTARYLEALANPNYRKAAVETLPAFSLPLDALPSYLTQTHEIYYLPDRAEQFLSEVVVTYLWPALLVALVLIAACRVRGAYTYLATLVAVCLAATYTWFSTDHCSYCVVRNLLLAAPPVAVMIPVGLYVLSAIDTKRHTLLRLLPLATLAIALVTLGLLSRQDSVLGRKLIGEGFSQSSDANRVIDRLAGQQGAVYLEAVDAGYNAPFEMPAIYHRVRAVAPETRAAISAENPVSRGSLYLGGSRKRHGSEYTDKFKLVITRVASVKTERRLIARSGPFALQRRASHDVAVTQGVAADFAWRDRRGYAWVVGPLEFWLSTGSKRPLWLKLVFVGPAAKTATYDDRGAGSARHLKRGLIVCKRVDGPAGLRRVGVKLAFDQLGQRPGGGAFTRPYPPQGLRLSSAVASDQRC